jgi:hypothetical protein
VCRFLNIQKVLKVFVLLSQESRTEILFYPSEKREKDSLVALLKWKKPEENRRKL